MTNPGWTQEASVTRQGDERSDNETGEEWMAPYVLLCKSRGASEAHRSFSSILLQNKSPDNTTHPELGVMVDKASIYITYVSVPASPKRHNKKTMQLRHLFNHTHMYLHAMSFVLLTQQILVNNIELVDRAPLMVPKC